MAEKNDTEKKQNYSVMPSLPVIDPVNIFGGEEAVEAAKKLLVDEFMKPLEFITREVEIERELVELHARVKQLEWELRDIRQPYLNDPIEALGCSYRVAVKLTRDGIETIGDLLDRLDRGPDALLAVRNFGEKSLDEVMSKLRVNGYLAEDEFVEDLEEVNG